MIEALEMRIEDAWCWLAGYDQPTTLYLTPRWRIWGFSNDLLRDKPNGSVEIGTYTKTILLADFRADVFAAFAELNKRG